MSFPTTDSRMDKMQAETIDIIEESSSIESGGELVSTVLAYPFAGAPRRAVLIAGPHPLMGGGLQNNVVRAVARGMAEHGLVSLRFAYGGAGPSTETMQEFWHTGHAPDDPHRVFDARIALKHLRSVCSAPAVFIGYSFGASVVGALLSEAAPSSLVLIGPTLCQHSFDAVQQSTIPKLVITANNDFATPLERTLAWYEYAQSPKKLVIIDAGEHFYRGSEDRLVEEIIQWL